MFTSQYFSHIIPSESNSLTASFLKLLQHIRACKKEVWNWHNEISCQNCAAGAKHRNCHQQISQARERVFHPEISTQTSFVSLVFMLTVLARYIWFKYMVCLCSRISHLHIIWWFICRMFRRRCRNVFISSTDGNCSWLLKIFKYIVKPKTRNCVAP